MATILSVSFHIFRNTVASGDLKLSKGITLQQRGDFQAESKKDLRSLGRNLSSFSEAELNLWPSEPSIWIHLHIKTYVWDLSDQY